MIDKAELRKLVLDQLQHDYELQLQAAKIAHEAATHEECIPDNKYATLGLEASYIAQGQANRAQDILRAQQQIQQMKLGVFPQGSMVRLSAVVELLDADNLSRTVFIAPAAGGLEILVAGTPVMIITPGSPLGRALLGKRCGGVVEVSTADVREYEIVAIS